MTRSVSDPRKAAMPNSVSSSPETATAASVKSKGRYANELQGQLIRKPDANKESAILLVECVVPSFVCPKRSAFDSPGIWREITSSGLRDMGSVPQLGFDAAPYGESAGRLAIVITSVLCVISC